MPTPATHPADTTTTATALDEPLHSLNDAHTAIRDGATMAAYEANLSEEDARFLQAVDGVMARLGALSAPGADDTTPQFTREQVSRAVNRGVDAAARTSGCSRHQDLDNLVVNAALTLLDDPEADFASVVFDCYIESPETVRSWL
ncbi:hypothetical protein [Streptomyces sp. NPDC020965]|uniref:hypothetical protein n=1 Tax=Streptomyces sp. NPDC020965 TaxID=3365105 RepID=UPI00378A9608